MQNWTAVQGDCLEVMKTFPANHFHSVVCDPPYHLTSIVKRFGKEGSAPAKSDGPTGVYARASRGFMGKEWDGGDIAFQANTWRAVMEVMKPGAHLLAFGGSRTFHRVAVAIENAGFEIRDTLMWIYGTGFPKSHDVSKAIGKTDPVAAAVWQGWGTALKPAFEPIIVARKPLDSTVAANILAHGCGGINIDACRVETADNLNGGAYASTGSRGSLSGDARAAAAQGMYQAGKTADAPYVQPVGRFPANVLHDGSDDVLAAFAEYGSRGANARASGKSLRGENTSVARFFYSAKATAADRAGSEHPTVKPLALIRWLTRLVTPLGGNLLDPFAGTGSTGHAALLEGFRPTLIEMTPEYYATLTHRMTTVSGKPGVHLDGGYVATEPTPAGGHESGQSLGARVDRLRSGSGLNVGLCTGRYGRILDSLQSGRSFATKFHSSRLSR